VIAASEELPLPADTRFRSSPVNLGHGWIVAGIDEQGR
jgi:hypothetical protein